MLHVVNSWVERLRRVQVGQNGVGVLLRAEGVVLVRYELLGVLLRRSARIQKPLVLDLR